MNVGKIFSQIGMNHLSVGRKDDDSFMGTRVDVAHRIDYDRTVGRAERRVSVRTEPPAGNRVEGHRSTSHPHRLGFFRSARWQRDTHRDN